MHIIDNSNKYRSNQQSKPEQANGSERQISQSQLEALDGGHSRKSSAEMGRINLIKKSFDVVFEP